MKRKLLIALHETDGIGWHTINHIVSVGDWDQYSRYTEKAWLTIGLKASQARAIIQSFATINGSDRQSSVVDVITYFDDVYPARLRETSQPPWVLYVIGNVRLLARPTIAIVGTRIPTVYGKKVAYDLAQALSERGVTVVSGMANGIDRMAHEGSLQAEGSSIAILGTPVTVIYPPQNRELYDQLCRHGLVISEVPPSKKVHPGHFPLRNRLIAGLTVGTIVVEAAERSGSLITALQALEMSREVFAVPGPVNSPKSAGTNNLIRESGAKLVANVHHILEEFMSLPEFQSLEVKRAETQSVAQVQKFTQDEQLIYDYIQQKTRSFDQLLELSKFEFGHLHTVLLNLTIKQWVEQQPGSMYRAR